MSSEQEMDANSRIDPSLDPKFPAALDRVRELAAGQPVTLRHLFAGATEFNLEKGATFVEFVGYAERCGVSAEVYR